MTIITTPRLVLRPPEDGDLPEIVRGLNNFNVSKGTARIPFPYGEEDAAEFLRLTRQAGPDVLPLAITLQEKLIGVISIEKGEIGYWLAEPCWGNGYGREAAHALVEYYFGGLRKFSLTARYHIGNEASRRILQGLGFVEIGKTAGFSRARNAEVPLMVLGMDRMEWQQAKERRR